MEFKRWRGFCLTALDGARFPADAEAANAPFAPLVLLTARDPYRSRGWFAVSSVREAAEAENCACLLPSAPSADHALDRFLGEHGGTVLNTAFLRALPFLEAPKPRTHLRAALVGLGDVGGTLLLALKLLGREFDELRIYDPNEALCRRYEQELNQVLPPDDAPLPRVTICPKEALFDCDVFLFTASRGVPPVGAEQGDVRLLQFEKNREMLKEYAKMARTSGFTGLFCQISDPVDQLSRVVFLESNRNENGRFDAGGLLPEQIQGFGLGVMAARAAYYAEKERLPVERLRVYGPHGADLVVANDPTRYDAAVSERLTRLTAEANLQVRALGFKPYIAPALSSAAVSILRLVRGQPHLGAIPLGGAYFGCRSRMTAQGVSICREALDPLLLERLEAARRKLEAFDYA